MQTFEANIASLPTTQKHFDLTVLLMRQQKLNYSPVVFVPCLNFLAQTKKKESDNLQPPKASNPKDRKICQLCFILQFLQLKYVMKDIALSIFLTILLLIIGFTTWKIIFQIL